MRANRSGRMLNNSPVSLDINSTTLAFAQQSSSIRDYLVSQSYTDLIAMISRIDYVYPSKLCKVISWPELERYMKENEE